MRFLPILRLLRVGTLFSPAADVVAGASVAGLPWSPELVRAALASLLLYAAGMVWNDIADRRLDAVQRPERPLPSGAVGLPAALGLGTALLAGGLLLSPCPLHHAAIAALVLVYDFLGKRVEWVGALLMGLLRGLNLGTGWALATALQADTPASTQRLLIAACCYAAYIVAVTILGIFEDLPHVKGRAVATVQSAPPLVAWAGIVSVQGSLWPAPALAALPALLFLRRNSRIRTWSQAEIRRSMTFLLLGTMLYTAGLSLAAGRWPEALGIVLAIVPARWISRRIALT